MEIWEAWTKEELENQMSPSRWNPTKSADEVISQHISVLTDETQKARNRIPCMLNISYGASDTQKYDLYGTDLGDNAPVIFWIHGGYWQEGSKNISGVLAESMHSNGIKTIVLGYTLTPAVDIKQIQIEMNKALFKAMGDHKEAKFIIGGHSAGGQLAASILHENHEEHYEQLDTGRLVGFLLFAGVFDLRTVVNTYVNDALKLTRDEAKCLSPLLLPFDMGKIKRDVAILVCVGGFDSPEFKRQSEKYAAKLSAVFTNVKLWISADDDHFTLIERLTSLTDSSPAVQVLKTLSSVISIK